MAQSTAPEQKPDWSATQYIKFRGERTRPVYDLIAQVRPLIKTSSPVIHDLGCGPGNSTQALLETFPAASRITGMDSSPDMLRKARSTFAAMESTAGAADKVSFLEGDLMTYEPDGLKRTDLLFSNAVFHWLRHGPRIDALVRLFAGLPRGGVLAIQVPDNYEERTNQSMRRVASEHGKSWSASFDGAQIGELSNKERPDLDPVEAPREFIEALAPYADAQGDGSSSFAKPSVNVWRTNYMHILPDARAIVEWVRGTGLQPFLQRIGGNEEREQFLQEYERELAKVYPALDGGRGVVLEYPRLFVVAVRGEGTGK